MKIAKGNIDRFLNVYPTTIEIATCILAIIFLIYKMRSTLIFGKTTFFHDNISWNYPIFQYFAENIIHHNFPFWNPFTHSGEPFYPILGQLRFFEPITLLTIYFGQFFSDDIVLLFNWNFMMKSLFMAFGVYIVFRSLARHLFIRLTLIPILLYSSFMIVSFRQCGLFDQFILVPFVTFFLLRIVYHKDYRWHNWLMLGATIGLNWQSYFFTGTWIFLLFFSVGFVLFRRDLLIELFASKMVFVKSVVLSAIILAMMAPSIVLVLEKDKFAFPARMLDVPLKGELPRGGPQQYEGDAIESGASSGINMPYRLITHTGTFSTIWDFIQLISPEGNRHFGWSGRIAWGNPSEAYMYIGIFPWFIALLGMVAGRDTMKKVWMLTLIAFGLLMLGPAGGLHRLLYYVYPPMWFVRHTHSFVLLFLFALLYFYILGINHIFETAGSSIFPQEKSQSSLLRFIKNNMFRKVCAIVLFSELLILSLYWMARLKYPLTNYLFGIIIFIAVIGWLLRNDMGKKWLYFCFVICHVVIVLLFSENYYKFFRYILPVTVVPIILFAIIKTKKNLSDPAKNYLTVILTIIFAVCLLGDLLYHFKKASKICERTTHPGHALRVDTHPQEPLLPVERSIYPKYSNNNYNNQETRYLSLIYRKPYVFSPIMEEDQSLRNYYFLKKENYVLEFEGALKSKRWNSFFVPRKYLELIHAEIPIPALVEMFAVNKPVFQFKQNVVPIDQSEISKFLSNLGAKKSVKLLSDCVLVDSELEPSLLQLEMSLEEYVAASSPGAEENSNTLENISSAKKAGAFSYSIEKYNYDSFDLQVSADQKGVLYWADGYDEGWQAYINEKEVPIYRANINFKAIALPEGENKVRFVYNPFLFKVTLIIFYGVFVTSLIAAVTARYQFKFASINMVVTKKVENF